MFDIAGTLLVREDEEEGKGREAYLDIWVGRECVIRMSMPRENSFASFGFVAEVISLIAVETSVDVK